MKFTKLIALCAMAALVAGCGSGNTVPDPEPTGEVYNDSGADTDGMGNDGLMDGEFFDENPIDGGELSNIIYFEFDSSELRPEDTDIVARHAVQLSSNPMATVRLEGHADERGSREYNIGLGERRSQTVRRLLLIQGVSADQISTVSFGEERPVADGSDEAAYSQNRRVEIAYIN